MESTLKSLTSTGKVSLDEDETIHLTYVIDRINKFGKIYINGVMCRASQAITGSSSNNNFYDKNKGRTGEGMLKRWTIILGIVFAILTIVLSILTIA